MPPPTDIVQKIEAALVAIVGASAAAQTLLGRATEMMVDWENLGLAPHPVYLKHFVAGRETGGAGDNRRIEFQVSAIAEGDGAKAKANAMIELAETLFTVTALAGQGVDAIVTSRNRRPGNIDRASGGTRDLQRSDITLEFWATKAAA